MLIIPAKDCVTDTIFMGIFFNNILTKKECFKIKDSP